MEPLVSVIMSVYDTPEKWLQESIESILGQTFRSFEFIIVLDCPTDNSEKIVENYASKDQRIKVIRNEKNIGLTKSLNKALSLSRGKYIARMDSDDISLPERLSIQYNYMESHSDVSVVGSYICSFGAIDMVEGRSYDDIDIFRIRMLFTNVGIPHPTAFIRKSVLLEHDIKYNEKIKKGQDYCLWSELMWYGKITEVQEVLLFYRIHEKQISFEARSKIKAVGQNHEEKESQSYYAHTVSLMQAERLLGTMTEEEKRIHVYVNMNDENIYNDDVDALYCYLRKLLAANREKELYNQIKLIRELKLIWLYKALVRLKRTGKSDMICTSYFLNSFTSAFIKEFVYIVKAQKRNRYLLKEIKEKTGELV